MDINSWLNDFSKALSSTFKERVWFVGLQGSYARNEATENSDIDVVVILDKLSAEDIKTYDSMLNNLPYRELVCGFISGKDEILNWEPSDLFQFYNDTKSIKGSLDEILELLDSNAVNRAIKIGVCNIYHGCVHNMLHDKSNELLISLYKSACFTVRAICFAQTGKYISKQKDLLSICETEEKTIVDTYIKLKGGGETRFEEMSQVLFNWSKNWISKAI